MKTAILYGLVLLTMLGIGLSCKDKVEEVKPPVITKPGSSTTPTSTTPVATTPTADTAWLAAYPPGCRIVKTVYKTLLGSKTIIIDPETVTLDNGQKVQVSLFGTDLYTYDVQGRISEIKTESTNGSKNLDLFRYSGDTLRIKRYFLSQPDTILLNANGFIFHLDFRYTSPGRKYNQDGQLINKYESTAPEVANRYENGNLIWEADIQRSNFIADQIVIYKYDLTRANLPVILQYYGKSSRNLPIEALRYVVDLSEKPAYRKTFTYTYDERGRVKRRVTHGTTLNPQWLIEDDPSGIGVTDYEYENCP